METCVRLGMPTTEQAAELADAGLDYYDHNPCFMVGAGSIFRGDQLLTTPNPRFDDDMGMFDNLGIKATVA